MHWEIGIDMDTRPRVKQRASGKMLWGTHRELGVVLWDDLEEQDVEVGGRLKSEGTDVHI